MQTTQTPTSPYMGSEATQSPKSDRRTLLSKWSRETLKSGTTKQSVHRVDSDDTLTQGATQRLKYFKDFRNPTDPTQYIVPVEYRKTEGPEKPTIREYRRGRQRRRILLNSSLRLFLTGLLCGMCALVLRIYQNKGDLHTSESQALNTLMTGLPLFIGLNYRSSLQSYARVLRWWILAHWDWKLRQFDLILDAASSKAIIKLLWHSRRRVRSYIPTLTQLACIAWLAINLTGAVGIALLSLTYQLEQSQGVLMKNGMVSVLDISNDTMWTDNAHHYGSSSTPVLLFPWAVLNGRKNFDGMTGSGNFSARPASCRTCTSWNYTFQDLDPASNVRGLSDRYVSSSANCKGYKVLNYTTTSVIYLDAENSTQSFHVPYTDKPWDTNNTFWHQGVGATYVHDTKSDCGSRCARVYIISTQNFNKPPVWLYNCTNTMSAIDGNNPYAPMTDATARAFAASAASYRNTTTFEFKTFQKYDWSQSWVLHDPMKKKQNDEIFAATTLAQFSITALANVDHTEGETAWLPDDIPARMSLRKMVPGKMPYQALKIDVSWGYALAIMCAVPGLQLLVLLTIVFFANDVVVKDESHLNTARLLAPVAQRSAHRGSLLQVDEVIESFGREDARYRYGWEMRSGMLRVGVIERLVGMVLGRKERQFPEGQYD
jgi:hypothetical protein